MQIADMLALAEQA